MRVGKQYSTAKSWFRSWRLNRIERSQIILAMIYNEIVCWSSRTAVFPGETCIHKWQRSSSRQIRQCTSLEPLLVLLDPLPTWVISLFHHHAPYSVLNLASFEMKSKDMNKNWESSILGRLESNYGHTMATMPPWRVNCSSPGCGVCLCLCDTKMLNGIKEAHTKSNDVAIIITVKERMIQWGGEICEYTFAVFSNLHNTQKKVTLTVNWCIAGWSMCLCAFGDDFFIDPNL